MSGSTGAGGGSGGGGGWFNQFNLDTSNLNLSSIASKVSSFVPTPFGEGDPTAFKKKNDNLHFDDDRSHQSYNGNRHHHGGHGDHGFEEIEDLNAMSSVPDHGGVSIEELMRMNRDLRIELNRAQSEFNEQISTRDHHIKALESKIVELRKATPPPPQSVTNSTADAERAAILQEKLNKAVSHLKPLIEENRNLAAKLQESESKCQELSSEIAELKNVGGSGAGAGGDDELKAEVDRLRQEHAFFKEHIASLEATVEEFNEKEDALAREAELANEAHQKAHMREKELAKRVKEIEIERDQTAKETERLTNQVESLKLELAKSTETARGLKDDVTNQLEQKISELEKALKSEKAEARIVEDIRQKATEELDRLTALHAEEIGALQQTAKKSMEELEDLKQRHDKAVEEISRLEKALKSEKAESRIIEDLRVKATEEIDRLVAVHAEEIDALQQSVTAKENDIQALTQRHERALDALKKEIASKDAEIDRLRAFLEGAASEGAAKDAILAEVDRLRKENYVLSKNAAELEELKVKEVEELHNVISELRQGAASSRRDVESEMETLKTEISRLTSLNEATVASLKEQHDAQLEEKSALVAALDGLKAEQKTEMEQLRELHLEALGQKDAMVNEVMEKLAAIKVDSEHSDSVVQEFTAKIESLNQTCQTAFETAERAGRDLAESHRQIEALQKSSYELQSQMDMLMKEKEVLTETLKEAESLRVNDQKEHTEMFHQQQVALIAYLSSVLEDTEVPHGQLSSELVQTVQRIRVAYQESVSARTNSAKEEASQSAKDTYEALLKDLNDEILEKNEAINQAREELQRVASERDRLSNDYSLLLERLSAIKNTLAPKLQEEKEESNRLRAEVDSLNQTVSNLKEERALLKTQIAALTNDGASLRDRTSQSSTELERLQQQWESACKEIESLQAENDKLSRKLTALQHHLAESEEAVTQETLKLEATLNEYKTRVLTLERDQESWEAMAIEARDACRVAEERALEAKEDLEAARNELDVVLRAKERDAVSLANLQSVLQEFQAFISLETYLSEAIRRAAAADNQVDRRLISNLIVQFLSTNRGDSKRFEMLQVIASVLRLSDEDKVKIGLLRKVGPSAQAGSPLTPANESFTDLWITFLMREANAGKNQPSDTQSSKAESITSGSSEAGDVPAAGPPGSFTGERRMSGMFGWGSVDPNDKKK
ncbi:hypothetical protein HDU76_003809 [Blyttiomyces sp. JEL0837]|nr:hypothetical protein HDU76_003809 [Blyttiomyces sp. JEL0837]